MPVPGSAKTLPSAPLLSDDAPRQRLWGVTVALTVICLGMATLYVALFTAFGRPDIGLVVAGLLVLPIPLLAWRRYARQRDALAHIEAERRPG